MRSCSSTSWRQTTRCGEARRRACRVVACTCCMHARCCRKPPGAMHPLAAPLHTTTNPRSMHAALGRPLCPSAFRASTPTPTCTRTCPASMRRAACSSRCCRALGTPSTSWQVSWRACMQSAWGLRGAFGPHARPCAPMRAPCMPMCLRARPCGPVLLDVLPCTAMRTHAGRVQLQLTPCAPKCTLQINSPAGAGRGSAAARRRVGKAR